MKSKLPSYVVDSLVSAGFDTLEVISQMDVSSNSFNSIDEVESYVRSEHPDWLHSGKFPPGHCLRIKMFVEGIRKSFSENEVSEGVKKSSKTEVPLGKRKRACGYTDGKGKRPKDGASSLGVFGATRRQIVKWKEQQSGLLRELVEEKHFEVGVDLDSSDDCTPFVHCLLCNRKFVLGNKGGSVMISNWTRHVTKCVLKSVSQGKQTTLNTFVFHSESENSSHTTSPSPSPQSSNQSFGPILSTYTSTPLPSPTGDADFCKGKALTKALKSISERNQLPCVDPPYQSTAYLPNSNMYLFSSINSSTPGQTTHLTGNASPVVSQNCVPPIGSIASSTPGQATHLTGNVSPVVSLNCVPPVGSIASSTPGQTTHLIGNASPVVSQNCVPPVGSIASSTLGQATHLTGNAFPVVSQNCVPPVGSIASSTLGQATHLTGNVSPVVSLNCVPPVGLIASSTPGQATHLTGNVSPVVSLNCVPPVGSIASSTPGQTTHLTGNASPVVSQNCVPPVGSIASSTLGQATDLTENTLLLQSCSSFVASTGDTGHVSLSITNASPNTTMQHPSGTAINIPRNTFSMGPTAHLEGNSIHEESISHPFRLAPPVQRQEGL